MKIYDTIIIYTFYSTLERERERERAHGMKDNNAEALLIKELGDKVSSALVNIYIYRYIYIDIYYRYIL